MKALGHSPVSGLATGTELFRYFMDYLYRSKFLSFDSEGLLAVALNCHQNHPVWSCRHNMSWQDSAHRRCECRTGNTHRFLILTEFFLGGPCCYDITYERQDFAWVMWCMIAMWCTFMTVYCTVQGVYAGGIGMLLVTPWHTRLFCNYSSFLW